jgi:GT2 family glycosyltransferase
MLIRAEAWKKAGGLDNDFFAHMEEIDLCWRLNLAGSRLCCVPSSVVYHVGGGALPYETPRKAFLNFRNNLFMLYKNLPEKDLRRILFIRKILDGVAAGVFLFTGKFWKVSAVFRAHMAYYRAIQSLRKKRKEVSGRFPGNPSALILNKSIVFEFYIKGKKTFGSLGTKFNKK